MACITLFKKIYVSSTAITIDDYYYFELVVRHCPEHEASHRQIELQRPILNLPLRRHLNRIALNHILAGLSRSDTPNNSMVLRGQSSMMSTHNPISWTALLEAVTSRWYE